MKPITATLFNRQRVRAKTSLAARRELTCATQRIQKPAAQRSRTIALRSNVDYSHRLNVGQPAALAKTNGCRTDRCDSATCLPFINAE
jgi:hypothetical protein